MGERISIFGHPGSGKSTIATFISKRLKCPIIEASTDLIFPLAKNFSTLPTESVLLSKFAKISKKKTRLTRENARNYFVLLSNKYGKDFIARALHEVYTNRSNKKCILLAGIRGYENAEYCRLHNDIVIYLKAEKSVLSKRLIKSRRYTRKQAEEEINEEEKLYKTSKIEKVADLVIDVSRKKPNQIACQILDFYFGRSRMCKICVNTGRNPSMSFNKQGICNICENYFKNFDVKHLKHEIEFLNSFKHTAHGKYDVMVGISGGKDSTATLYTLKKMGFNPLAFTFNTGYLPKTTIPRSREIAKLLNCKHELIDVRKYLNKRDIKCFEKTAKLYELPFNLDTKKKFKKTYDTARKHYSIKCTHTIPFVRSCQLCRRMVIRAYYGEAIKHNVHAIILGINEWTNLSSAQRGGKFKVSGMRKLQPYKNKPAVYVFHLPFLLQRNSTETRKILRKLNWKEPKGEDFIESNSNSCLFARSTERMAKRILEFHPDSTRLAREVTVGFITKKQALKALKKLHSYKYSPREVLSKARILPRKVY
jgi:tRNA(Ile)-lysidine synthase TilS/MesJ/adenylate kinase family enzyme